MYYIPIVRVFCSVIQVVVIVIVIVSLITVHYAAFFVKYKKNNFLSVLSE